MNIVLLESLGIPDSLLNEYAKPLTEAGHCFTSYPKDTDLKSRSNGPNWQMSS